MQHQGAADISPGSLAEVAIATGEEPRLYLNLWGLGLSLMSGVLVLSFCHCQPLWHGLSLVSSYRSLSTSVNVSV